MTTLLQDLRHTLRQLLRTPIFAATAVLTLAIGMGVNTVAFTVVNGLLFKGTMGKGIPGVGRIATTPGGDESGYASIAEYQRFTEATEGAVEVAAEGRSSLAWRHDGTTETAWVLHISDNYFSLVDAPVVAGRLRVERTEDGTPSAVIGERFWREKLGAPSLADLVLRLNNADVSVAGVIAESFTGPAGIYSPDVWLPLDHRALFGTPPALERHDTRWLYLMGRPGDGVSPAEVQARLETAAAAMAREWPETHKDRGARFWMLGQDNSELRGLRTGAAIVMGVIGLVLLLACFNVANLLLARAVERERDMGIRAALGARPRRLIRLVIVEGFVIAGLSGLLALALASWTRSLLTTFAIPIEQPQHIDLTPDSTVILFVTSLIVLAGVLPGVWPAIAAARVDVVRVLGSQGANAVGARPSRLRRWLVGAQIAGATMFLAIAGLFVQSFAHLTDTDYGFASDRLIVVEVEPASSGYGVDASARYVGALAERVGSLPGVTHVAIADRAPFFIGPDRRTPVWPDAGACEPDGCPAVETVAAGPGYFGTMGIALTAGREFQADDQAPEVLVNQAFVRQRWPDGGGLGKTLRIGTAGTAVTVVGITAPHHTRGLDREQPAIYVPLAPVHYEGLLALVVKTAGDPAPLVPAIGRTGQAVDPNVSMLATKTMRQRMEVQLWPFRTVSWLFTICGTLALILATVGLAGVVIHAVNRRWREFGVRVSVGATPRDLMRDVLRDGVRLLVPGLVVGLALAAAGSHLARAAFIGVDVLNPATYLAVALLQGAVVLVACLWPAVRASAVDPLVALRSD